ncbi:MAG: penicillin acylase family protein [Pseudomonadota bacterium]
MRRTIKVLMWTFLAALGVAGLALGLVYYLATGSLPDYERRVTVAGISAPVEIVRDRHAVPHITGDTDADVFFGLGFVHAQDRLWQLTMLRRTAHGRLSELFGEATFSTDHLMRALDLKGVAQRQLAGLSAETRKALEAYAAGINARLRQIQTDALGRGAPEFFLFSPQLDPWTPVDSIMVNRIMALQLTGQARFETKRAELSLLLDPARLEDILPRPPFLASLPLPRYADLVPGAEARGLALTGGTHPFDPDAADGHAGASNAWAASPRRSATQQTLLAGDPHLGFSAPAIWMLAHMNFPDGGVIGGTIPGLPVILIGRNADFGWSLTTANLDDTDIYIERLAEDGAAYETPDGPEPFVTRRATIALGEDQAREVTLRWTRHGPVIPGDTFGASGVTPPGHVAALAWTGLDPADRSMDAGLALMRARTVAEGREAVRPIIAPSQNLIMADRDSIGFQVFGRAPFRRDTHAGQGRLPVPGWVRGNDWQGYLPYEDNPGDTNPVSGLVINTNNRTTAAEFPRHVTYDWGDSQRIRRARRLLGEREFHTIDSFVEAQTDIVSEPARTLLPLIGRDLWFLGGPADTDRLSAERRAALDLLAEWNGEMSEHAPEPLIYAAWVRALQRRLIEDDLGPLQQRFESVEPLFIERVFRDVDGAAAWCDVRTSGPVETCDQIARLALDDALDELLDTYGGRPESWRWGEAHVALHHHQVLGRIPLLNYVANIEQTTSGGDHTLMRGRMAGGGDRPYANIHGSGLRVVYDFGDPEASRYIISTGQSGHPLSRHYDDLSVLWRRGEYIPMSLSLERARNDALGVTVLEPN